MLNMKQWANCLAQVSSLDVDSSFHTKIQDGVHNGHQKVNFNDNLCKRGKI